MLGIETLERAYSGGYTGAISLNDHKSFWDGGQLLAVTSPDDLAWVCHRLKNRGLISDTFANTLKHNQQLSFLCFPQVPAGTLKKMFVGRMHQNLFVFSMLNSEAWEYSGHMGRLKLLRSEETGDLLERQRQVSRRLSQLYWQVSKLWIRFLSGLPEWLSHPSTTQPLRQLVLDSPFEEHELLAQVEVWETEGFVQISETPARISAELTAEEKILFQDHDRYRGPVGRPESVDIIQSEEEEIALSDDVSSEITECIAEANLLLASLEPTIPLKHSLLKLRKNEYSLEVKGDVYDSVQALVQVVHEVFQFVQQECPDGISRPELLKWERRWRG